MEKLSYMLTFIRNRQLRSGTLAYAKTEREWAERAARHIKAELKRAEMTYDELADKLKKHGFKESKASIASKLSRATVPAAFFLAALVAMGKQEVTLEDI
jgi:hypothetical protein